MSAGEHEGEPLEPEEGPVEPELEAELTPAPAPPWWAWALVTFLLAQDLYLLGKLMRARAFSRLTETYAGGRVTAHEGLMGLLDRLLEED